MPTLVLSPSSSFPTVTPSAPGFDSSGGFDSGAFGSDWPVPQLDIEWAPASAPGDAPSWRSFINQPDGIRSLQTKVGRPAELQRFSDGTCAVELENWKGWYDPDNAVSPVAGMAVPNRQIRVVARVAGNTYYLFQGYLDGWPQPFGYPTPDPIMQLNATDVFKLLARQNLPSSMYELAVSIDRPAHWWRLDETSTLTAWDHTFATTPMFGTYVGVAPGAAGIIPYDGGRTSLALDHTSRNRVDISAGQIISSYPFTIEAWIKCPSAAAEQRYIFWQGPIGYSGYVQMIVDSTFGPGGAGFADTLALQITDAINTRQVNTNAVVADGLVHHVVGVATSGTSLQLYVDGVAATQTTTSAVGGAPSIFGLNAALGGISVPSGAFGLDGSLSNVATYSYALSASQILNHYNAGKTAFSGEASGTRVGRVLDYLGFPTARRSIQTGNSLLGAADLPGGKAIDYFQTLADTEQNQWYGDGQGNLVWRNRTAVVTESRSKTSQATFSDASGATYQYARLQYDLNELNVYNDVSVQRTGGAVQRVQDAASQRKYFTQSLSLSGGIQASDNDTNDCAHWIVDHHKDPPNRIMGLELEPAGDMPLFAQALGRQIGDRITVTRTVAGVQYSSDFIIEGIEHSFSMMSVWLTIFRLFPADTQSYWIWDDPGTKWNNGVKWGF